MSTLAKRQENGHKGETRTLAFIADSFWVWKRSVDVDGADFLLQEPANTLKELRDRQRRIETMGIVQSKFFEGQNEVEVGSEYVVDEEGPRTDFFVSIHTDDAAGNHVDYFFSGPEVLQHFRQRTNDDGKVVFAFSLAKNREFLPFRNMPPKAKNQKILDGMKATSVRRNDRSVTVVLRFARDRAMETEMGSPIQVSESEWRMSDATADYVWQKQGLMISGKKIDRATGTASTITAPPCDPHKCSFDPTTGTYSTRLSGL